MSHDTLSGATDTHPALFVERGGLAVVEQDVGRPAAQLLRLRDGITRASGVGRDLLRVVHPRALPPVAHLLPCG